MAKTQPLQIDKPKPLDNFVGIIFLISAVISPLIWRYYHVNNVVGLPWILYGAYGLLTTRLWVIGTVEAPGNFISNKKSIFWGIGYILFGLLFNYLT